MVSGDPAPVTPDRFRELFSQSGVAQALASPDGIVTDVNAALCGLFRQGASNILGHPLLGWLSPECRDQDERLLAEIVDGTCERGLCERRFERDDGSLLDVLVAITAVRDSAGDVREISVCLQDITEFKDLQRSAEDALARWRSLSQNASDVALIADLHLLLTYVSPAFTTLLGHREIDVVGRSLVDLVHPEDKARVAAAMRRFVLRDGEQLTLQFRIRDSAGMWRQVEQRAVNLVSDSSVRGLVANVRDVTKQHALEQSLRRTVLEDRLTGLPNRTLIMDRVQHAIERERSTGQRYALLFANVDRLKAINEAFGHAVGDQILRTVADTLCAFVRPADTVGRYAGGEFAVLLDEVGEAGEAEAMARRMTAALNMVIDTVDARSVHVSACVGLAHGPACTAEALVSAAEAATYRAKELGRGRMYILEDGLRDRVAEQRALGAELTVAVAEHRLAVHYQPIVDLSSGNIVCFEALVRWPHPERGLVGPDTFLPLADALDLQVAIDEWVLFEACRTAVNWRARDGVPVALAVNVAPAHLTAPGFAAHVHRALAESGLPAQSLVLEVTETAVVADPVLAGEVLTALSELGVRVSIDDFGTGYSSILQLRQLPFDKLKIDREFVRGLPKSSDDLAICASVISLADRLGVSTIAEGVEHSDQAATLAALGCGFGQGFLWSAAVDTAGTVRLLAETPWETTQAGKPARRIRLDGLAEHPELLDRVRDLHDLGASLHSIAANLNRDGHRTADGRRWRAATVARLLYSP